MLLLGLILLAASTQVELVNEVIPVPARDWRYVEVALKQRPARVVADYTTGAASPDVRLELVRREDVEGFPDRMSGGVIAGNGQAAASGGLHSQTPLSGEFALIIDNRLGVQPASVHLRVALDFTVVTGLTPARRLLVVVISFAVFFGIVTYSARRILRAIRQ
jgi:hypothetical protein